MRLLELTETVRKCSKCFTVSEHKCKLLFNQLSSIQSCLNSGEAVGVSSQERLLPELDGAEKIITSLTSTHVYTRSVRDLSRSCLSMEDEDRGVTGHW